MNADKKPRDRRWIWPVLLAAAIILVSSRSRVASVDVPDSDKVAHFAVYGLLGTLVCRLGKGWRAAAGALVAVSLFGATDEWHQSFVPGRSPTVSDWVADTLGAAVAVVLYTASARYRRWLELEIGRPGKPRLSRTRAVEPQSGYRCPFVFICGYPTATIRLSAGEKNAEKLKR